MRCTTRHLLAAVASATALTVGPGLSPAGAADGGPTVVASGLDNPRGLAWASDGSLLVTEAGRGGDGPCFDGPEGMEYCFGLTGALTRVSGATQERVLEGLPSLAEPDGSSATGPHDVSVDHGPQGGTYLLVGLGGGPDLRDELPDGAALGWLHRLGADWSPTPVADLAGWEARFDPDADEVDSNPYGVLAVYGQQFVVDAGGNSLIHRGVDGRLSTLATFGAREVDAPPFLPLPPGATLPMQAVPTAVTLGPDGALYVSQLTGFPFPLGGARIYRWAATGVTVYAEGFTNVVDLDFGPDGSLYVLEIAKASLLEPEEGGRLVRVAPDGTRTVVAEEGLLFPSAVLVGDDGAAYVANCGVCAGRGEVWRYEP